MPREAGRNDPCPCGSGRKYKHCCLKANEASDFRWRQIRAAEGRFVPELLALALHEFGAPFISAALEEFFLWEGVPENYDQTEEFSSFFVPWFVYEFVDDSKDAERVANAPVESLAALYLRRHGDRLSLTERTFLTSASASPHGVRNARRTPCRRTSRRCARDSGSSDRPSAVGRTLPEDRI